MEEGDLCTCHGGRSIYYAKLCSSLVHMQALVQVQKCVNAKRKKCEGQLYITGSYTVEPPITKEPLSTSLLRMPLSYTAITFQPLYMGQSAEDSRLVKARSQSYAEDNRSTGQVSKLCRRRQASLASRWHEWPISVCTGQCLAGILWQVAIAACPVEIGCGDCLHANGS